MATSTFPQSWKQTKVSPIYIQVGLQNKGTKLIAKKHVDIFETLICEEFKNKINRCVGEIGMFFNRSSNLLELPHKVTRGLNAQYQT